MEIKITKFAKTAIINGLSIKILVQRVVDLLKMRFPLNKELQSETRNLIDLCLRGHLNLSFILMNNINNYMLTNGENENEISERCS